MGADQGLAAGAVGQVVVAVGETNDLAEEPETGCVSEVRVGGRRVRARDDDAL